MKERSIDILRENELMNTFDLSRLCARVLTCKEMNDEEITMLLSAPQWCDPMRAVGMREVIDRICLAREQKEQVLVCGDYDADGICGTAILVDALRSFGIQTGFYIPNRLTEGYGLHSETIDMAKAKGYSLLITVDNGVRAFEAVRHAKNAGMDVIVTDHHVLDETQPLLCDLLLHPQRMGEDFRMLSGAGIAFEITRALQIQKDKYVVYAGIAAIGDVMEMRGETRMIVKQCIKILNQNRVRSIQLLANDSSAWDETKIAFQIVPKINVTGRLADRCNANNTVRYLLSEDGNVLINVSKQIHSLNDMRKSMSTQMMEVALKKITADSAFIIVSDASFHEGIVGLVAGKLCEQFQRPCMVLAPKGDLLRGSIRSVPGVDLSSFFNDLSCLKEFGGHAMAAGIAFDRHDLGKVELYAQQHIQSLLPLAADEPIYIPIEKDLLTAKEVKSLSMLRPFGNGFEEPRFCVKDLSIRSARILGNQQHMKWVEESGMELLYFNVKDRMYDLKEGGFKKFAGKLSVNHFKKKKKVNMILETIER